MRGLRRGGSTLVELMIALAMLGILFALSSNGGRSAELQGLGELQRERAWLVLDYRADCAARGVPVDDAVQNRLLDTLPGASVEVVRADATVTLTVHWRGAGTAGGLERASITVFQGAQR